MEKKNNFFKMCLRFYLIICSLKFSRDIRIKRIVCPLFSIDCSSFFIFFLSKCMMMYGVLWTDILTLLSKKKKDDVRVWVSIVLLSLFPAALLYYDSYIIITCICTCTPPCLSISLMISFLRLFICCQSNGIYTVEDTKNYRNLSPIQQCEVLH